MNDLSLEITMRPAKYISNGWKYSLDGAGRNSNCIQYLDMFVVTQVQSHVRSKSVLCQQVGVSLGFTLRRFNPLGPTRLLSSIYMGVHVFEFGGLSFD